MRKTIALVAASVLSAAAFAGRAAAADVSVDLFYDSLQPYGDWIQTADYGYVWHPKDAAKDWRPYTKGSWAYTNDGWTFVSEEPHAWATYHYGRWADIADTGWVWVPESTWAPAWVSWRTSDKYVGWAPLPPEARFDESVGIQAWADSYYDIGPASYNFVETRQLGAPDLATVVVGLPQNETIISETKTVTDIRYSDNFVHVGGPRYDVVSREVAQPIRQLQIDARTDVAFEHGNFREESFRSSIEGNTLHVAAPRVNFSERATPPHVARTLDRVQVNHGWNGVPQAEKLRAEIHRDAPKTPAGLPAQPRFERTAATAGANESNRAANGAAQRENGAVANGENNRGNVEGQNNGRNPAVNAQGSERMLENRNPSNNPAERGDLNNRNGVQPGAERNANGNASPNAIIPGVDNSANNANERRGEPNNAAARGQNEGNARVPNENNGRTPNEATPSGRPGSNIEQNREGNPNQPGQPANERANQGRAQTPEARNSEERAREEKAGSAAAAREEAKRATGSATNAEGNNNAEKANRETKAETARELKAESTREKAETGREAKAESAREAKAETARESKAESAKAETSRETKAERNGAEAATERSEAASSRKATPEAKASAEEKPRTSTEHGSAAPGADRPERGNAGARAERPESSRPEASAEKASPRSEAAREGVSAKDKSER